MADTSYEFYDWDGILVRRSGGLGFPEKLDGGEWVRQMIQDTMTSLYPISEEEASAMAEGADLNAPAKDTGTDTEPDKTEDAQPGGDLKEAAKAEDPKDDPPDTEPDKTEDKKADTKGGMSAQQIRDAGLAIDLPYEVPDAQPERLRYAPATDGREEWVPPEGFEMGGVPWDQLSPIGDAQAAPGEPPPDASPVQQ